MIGIRNLRGTLSQVGFHKEETQKSCKEKLSEVPGRYCEQ